MKCNSVFTIIVAATAFSATTTLAGTDRVFIPEGSADAVRIVDATSGAVLGRIDDIQAVHGLAGHRNSPYLIAGSYMESDPRIDLSGIDFARKLIVIARQVSPKKM